MPHITPNACARLLPRSTRVPHATHHAQCVFVHRPLLSITSCTKCSETRPRQFRSSLFVAHAFRYPQCMRASPSKTQVVYHMPRITPNAFPCIIPFPSITLCTICLASPLKHFREYLAGHVPLITPNSFPCMVHFRASLCTIRHCVLTPNACVRRLLRLNLCTISHASCPMRSVHRPLPSITLCTIRHSSRPMQFRSPPLRRKCHFSPNSCAQVFPRLNLCTTCHSPRPMRFRASSPSERHLVYQMPLIMPSAFLCIPSSTLCTICHASHPRSSVNHLAYHMPRITPNAFPCIVPIRASLRACVRLLPRFKLCTICLVTRPIRFRASCPFRASLRTICHASRPMRVRASSPFEHHFVYHMPRITPNEILLFALHGTCHASPTMRVYVSLQDLTCVPFATHHAQCVSVHRPLPSNTLYTKCHASCPLRFRSTSPSYHHNVYNTPRIILNACVLLLPRFNLCTICHASCPMQFRSSPCVPYAMHHPHLCFRASSPSEHHLVYHMPLHHPQCVRASPSKIQLVYHMPRIKPNAFPCIVSLPSITLCTVCHASRPMQFRLSPCRSICNASLPKRACLHLLPRFNLCTICHASRPTRLRASSPSKHHHCAQYATHPAHYNIVNHLAYQMPRITPNTCVCLLPRFNLCTVCHAPYPIRFRALSPSENQLVTLCHASHPMHLCASSPSDHHFVCQMPSITPMQLCESPCVPYATHHPQCVSGHRLHPRLNLRS